MKFYVENQKGKLIFNDFKGIKTYLKSLDGNIEIRVRPTKDIRTLAMNNLYWLWLTAISDSSGYTKRELHNYFKTKLLCVEDKVLDEYIIDCGSTSDLSVKNFILYLEEVARLAAQNFHVVLLDPNRLVFK